MKLQAFVILALFFALPAGAQEQTKSHSGLLELAAGYGSGLMCSCLFVMKQDYDFCVVFARPTPNLVLHQVDYENKSVKTWFLWESQTRKLVSPRLGCG